LPVAEGGQEGPDGPEEHDDRHDDGQVVPRLRFDSRARQEMAVEEAWSVTRR
jgi:hypothetical protein